MPKTYTCQGRDVSPPLAIAGVPAGAKSLALLMDDPDAPDPAAPKMVWDHWVVFNIPPGTNEIPEGGVPSGSVVGKNSWPKNAYGGPCPPIGTHRYFFKLYALGTTLPLGPDATKKDVERAMQGHVLEKAELVGLYKKK
jgi:Raf kinase inhibitor-like YbhB/YbcL family protein